MSDFLRVMIIDDEEDYAESLKDRAAYKGIRIMYEQILEDGLAELYDNYSSYDGLILDGKGYLTAEETSATSWHVHKALKELDEYDKEGKIIPRVINTGYFEDFEGISRIHDIEVFDKSGGEDKMLETLIDLIKNSDMYKYRKQYQNIFSLFANKYFPERKELDLVQILNALNSQEQSVIKANLALVRTFLEPFYKAIGKVGEITENEYLPKEFIKNGEVNLFWSEIYVTGRKVKGNGDESWEPVKELVDNHIGRQLEFIRTVCNKAGSHDYEKKVSSLTLKSAAYSLLNILDWYHSWLQKLKH